jgi:branched-subunit amino acid transport protein AzlD
MSYMGQALAFLGHILATAKNMFKAMYVMPTQFTKLCGFFIPCSKAKEQKALASFGAICHPCTLMVVVMVACFQNRSCLLPGHKV